MCINYTIILCEHICLSVLFSSIWKFSQEFVPDSILVIRDPYASMVVKGIKIWEIRAQPCRMRKRVCIGCGGKIIGEATIVDCRPMTGAMYKQVNMHRVQNFDMIQSWKEGTQLWAWVFTNPRKYTTAIPYDHPRGAINWVKIPKLLNDSRLNLMMVRLVRSPPPSI